MLHLNGEGFARHEFMEEEGEEEVQPRLGAKRVAAPIMWLSILSEAEFPVSSRAGASGINPIRLHGERQTTWKCELIHRDNGSSRAP